MASALASLTRFAPSWAWVVLGAPLVEEVIFRAGLQTWLIDRLAAHPRVGRLAPALQAALAISLTALAFAAAHLARQPGLLSLLTVLPALLLGGLYQQQRRLRCCVLLHGIFNGLWLLHPSLSSAIETLPSWMS
jgi:membrane protease YdiL (CAAX protease family)